MNQQKNDIQELIRKEFPLITNEKELLDLLNNIHIQLHQEFYSARNKKVPPIKMTTLKYYKNIKVSQKKRYREFSIKKKSGKERIISAPAKGLKLIQQSLNEIFQAYYEPNNNVCGFIPGRSIADGAKMHTNKSYVLNIDLKDFFDTICFPRIMKVLMLPPFNLNGDKKSLAYIITSLCCHGKTFTIHNETGEDSIIERQVLPQGAPTSPILTNLVCRTLDRHLAGLAKRFKAKYSRYADDITFSSNKRIFGPNSPFMIELQRIIEEEQRLVINNDKTRIQTNRQRQEVTGIVVNKKINVTQNYIKQIRLWLHYWEIFGLERAQQYFIQQYINQRGHVKRHDSRIENVIGGKLDYMRMIVGESNLTYQGLRKRFDKLTENQPRKETHQTPIVYADENGIQSRLPILPPEIDVKDGLLPLLDELINDLQ